MDDIFLSRLQFAAATMFHFLFVPISLGLPILIGIMETKFVRTGDAVWRNLAKFWGKILIIIFVVGVVTGITLEFQFGTNWAGYSKYVGNVFGPLLAIEATTAFFLESTFISVWVFGWNRLSPKIHAMCMWIVALASSFSAIWILFANSWMQNPVGYEIRNGRAEITNFWAILTNSFAINQVIHTISAGFVVSGFFVLSISAYMIVKKRNTEAFARSFRIAAVFALIFTLVVIAQGHIHGAEVAKYQPAKMAAMEPTWETQKNAPIHLFFIPDEKQEKNLHVFGSIPGALSMLAFHSPSAEVKGLKEFPKEDRPPVLITAASFRFMVMIGFALAAVSIVSWWIRKNPQDYQWLLRPMSLAFILPLLACQFGWLVTEVGRQPWIVYNVMRTSDAASKLTSGQVGISLAVFIVVYSLIGIVAIFLITRVMKKGLSAAALTETY
jgi:cytochrome d ubiquinol oxidase subunit I